MKPALSFSRTDSSVLNLPDRHCLLLGANGAGMTALAEILASLGHNITGIDQNAESVQQPHPQIRIFPWQHDTVTKQSFDLCISSPAILQTDPILRQLRNSGIPVVSLHECLAGLFADSRQICVAGTHGKSTTSAMLAWILDFAGLQPGFFVGAHQTNFAASGRGIDHGIDHGACSTPTSRSAWSILESCEYSRSFHHFSPSVVVLTGIERDHFDCFPDQASEDTAFQVFADKLPADGTLVVPADCPRSQQLAATVGRRTATFRLIDQAALKIGSAKQRSNTAESENHWIASQIRHVGDVVSFQLQHKGQQSFIQLAIPGRHNVANAVAATVAACEAGVSLEQCREALGLFRGIRRRFEFRGLHNGMTLVDDYAHHPTAIRATLQTTREAFPGRKIIAAFEPHQVIRTAALFPEFVNSLLLADEILLLPAFPARENVTHLECCRTSGRLVKELNNRGARAFLFANLDQIVSRIDHSGRPNDILLTMGAGRTNLIHDQLTERLQRHSVA